MASVGLKNLRVLLAEAREDLSAPWASAPEDILQAAELLQIPESSKSRFRRQALVTDSPHRLRTTPRLVGLKQPPDFGGFP